MVTTPCIQSVNKPNPTHGYALRVIDGKRQYEHRAAWESVHGPIPPGMVIDHQCHDPLVCQLGIECPHRSCINVEHMKVVTHEENVARGDSPQARRTHCPHGHEYSADNTYVDPRGSRHCRTCTRRYIREHKERRRT